MTEQERIKEMANRYARVFLGTDEGRLVLADLRKRFSVVRLSFDRSGAHRQDAIGAAIIDGERGVMLHIEGALTVAGKDLGLEGYLP